MAKNLMVLYGKNSIAERLKANPGSIRKMFLQDNFQSAEIEDLMRNHKIRYERLTLKKMERITKAKNIQGIIAKVNTFEYASLENLLNGENKKINLIFLDCINDPHNLGVIMRTLACFGNCAVIIPGKEACVVNDTVMHVALGGENYVPVVKAEHFTETIQYAKQKGYSILGAVPDTSAQSIHAISLSFPIGLVVGSEKTGIHEDLLPLLDNQAYIPMAGAHLSLNVTIACAIFCIEILKQQTFK